MKLLQNLYPRLTLITCVTLITGYALVYAWTTLDPNDAGSGKPLTSTLMQGVINNVNDLNTRVSNLWFSGGKVGIGTVSPVFNLDVDNSIRVKKSSWNSRIEMLGGSDGTSSSSIYIYNPGNQLSTVFSDGTYSSYLNAYGGNVGIGTTSPWAKLTVGIFGGATGLGTGIRTNGSNDFMETYMYSDNAGAIQVNIDNNTAVGPLLLNPNGGSVGIGTTNPSYALDVNGYIRGTNVAVSDQRFKQHITPISSALDTVKKLQGVTFDWRVGEFKDRNFPEGKQVGFIAQEVEKVIPEVVTTDKQGYKGVEYSNITAVLVEAVKELSHKLDELFIKYLDQQKEIDVLKIRLNRLEQK